MKYTFLGTATSQGIPVLGCNCATCTSDDPKDKRLRSALLIQGEHKNYVIDAGPDFRAQMLRENIEDLEAVFLTHEHTDHMIGLDDLRPYIFKQKKDMPIYALHRVIGEVKKRFDYAFVDNGYKGAPRFEMIPLQYGKEIKLDELKIKPIKVNHGSLEIAGFVINDFMVYITDAKTLDQDLITQIKGCKVLVINALRIEAHHSHLSLSEALDLIEQIGPEESYLTHLSHLMGKTSLIQQQLPSNVNVAYDGLVINAPRFLKLSV